MANTDTAPPPGLDNQVLQEVERIRASLQATPAPDAVELIDRIVGTMNGKADDGHYLTDYAQGDAFVVPGMVRRQLVQPLIELRGHLESGNRQEALKIINGLLESDRFTGPATRALSGQNSTNYENARYNMEEVFDGEFNAGRFAQDTAEHALLYQELQRLQREFTLQQSQPARDGAAIG